MDAMTSQANLMRRRILRVHALFLFLVTIVVTTITLVGWSVGKGPFALWHEQQFAAVGLFQAYLLMFVLAIVLWLGSNMEGDLWKWDLIGLLGHLPPLAANFIFFGLFTSYGFQHDALASIMLHTAWVAVELFAIFYKAPSAVSQKVVI